MLFLLATREAARLGISISDEQVESTSHAFRRTFGLAQDDVLVAWMKEVGLDRDGLTRCMRAFTTVAMVQSSLAAEIEALIDTYLKVESARRRER